MTSISWWRSWHGAPTDHKWAVIAARAGVKVGIVSAVAWALMDHASQANPRGSVADFDTEVYAVYSGFDEAEIIAVIKAMTDKGIITDGKLTNWTKRQPQREDNSTERVRQWREMKRNVTQSNAEKSPDTDTDKDVDKDVEVSDGGYDSRSPFRVLFDAFLEESGCKETLISPSRSADEINKWLKAGVTTEEIKTAVAELKGKNFSIGGPWSITNSINIVKAKNSNIPANGNGGYELVI